MFYPKTKKYPYTEYTDGHYITIKKNKGINFDKDYPYLDESKKFKFKRFWFRIFFRLIVIPVSNIRLGLRVKGRKNLKKYKDVINGGIISVCNHMHYWDYLGILHGIRYHKPKFLAWASNINGGLGGAMRLVGGIPIPETGVHATMSFTKAINKHLNNGGWLHIYSEGSMWEYYKPIRPFKKGAATFACKLDKPILPMAYRYRKPCWIRRVIFKQIATLTLCIGEPIYKNDTLDRHEQILDLTIRSHEEVCKLAGIDPKENIYKPVYENSKKIVYY